MSGSGRFFTRLISIPALTLSLGCALGVTRPVQEMSNTQSALRAAKEVNADTLAPELFRQASEWFFKARQHYRLKNFKEAQNSAITARHYAEEAEFEAVRNGAQRESLAPPDPLGAVSQKKDPTFYNPDEYEDKNSSQFFESVDKPKDSGPKSPGF